MLLLSPACTYYIKCISYLPEIPLNTIFLLFLDITTSRRVLIAFEFLLYFWKNYPMFSYGNEHSGTGKRNKKMQRKRKRGY